MQATATSSGAGFVNVLVDGADTECPAEVVSGLTVTSGWRVLLTVRTPQMPLVTGRVS